MPEENPYRRKSDEVMRYFDNALKLGTFAALVGVALLGTKFATREEFAMVNQRIEKIEAVLIRMEANAETDKRHDLAILDHEQRLRRLEQK
jgi:hypothetical protein